MVKFRLSSLIFGITSVFAIHTLHAMDKDGHTKKPTLDLTDIPGVNEVNVPSPTHVQATQQDTDEQDEPENADQDLQPQQNNPQTAKPNPSVEQPKMSGKKKKKKKKPVKKAAQLLSEVENIVQNQFNAAKETKIKIENESTKDGPKKKKEVDKKLIFYFKDKQDFSDMQSAAGILASSLSVYAENIKGIDKNKQNILKFQFKRLLIGRFALAIIDAFKNAGIDDTKKFSQNILKEYTDIDLVYENPKLLELRRVGDIKSNYQYGLTFERIQLVYLLAKTCQALGYAKIPLLLEDLYTEIKKNKQGTRFTQFHTFILTLFFNYALSKRELYPSTNKQQAMLDLRQQFGMLKFFSGKLFETYGATDWCGIPLLHYAAFFDCEDFIKYLLTECKPPMAFDAIDKEGRTALMIAGGCCNESFIYLATYSARQSFNKIWARDIHGKSVHDHINDVMEVFDDEGKKRCQQFKELLAAIEPKEEDNSSDVKKKLENVPAELAEHYIKTESRKYPISKDLIIIAIAMHKAMNRLATINADKYAQEINKQIAAIEVIKFAKAILEYFKKLKINNPDDFTKLFLVPHLEDGKKLAEFEQFVLKRICNKQQLTALFMRAQKLCSSFNGLGEQSTLSAFITYVWKLPNLNNVKDFNCDDMIDQCIFHQQLIEGDYKKLKFIPTKNKYVLEHDCFGISPILYACIHNHPKTLEFLYKHLDKNFELHCNQSDNQGRIPLIFANNQRLEFFKSRTNINFCDAQGKTALIKAIESLNIPVMEALIGCGANLNVFDSKGKTPLVVAYENVHKVGQDNPAIHNVIKILVEAGATVNMPNEKGQTALYKAVLAGEVEVVKSLLYFNADFNRAINGLRIYDCAKQFAANPKNVKHQQILSLFDAKIVQLELEAKKKEEEKQKKERLNRRNQVLEKLLEKRSYLMRKAQCKPAFDAWQIFTKQVRGHERKLHQEKVQAFRKQKQNEHTKNLIRQWHVCAQEQKRDRELNAKADAFRHRQLATTSFNAFRQDVKTALKHKKMAEVFRETHLKTMPLKAWKQQVQTTKDQKQMADQFRIDRIRAYDTQLLKDALNAWRQTYENQKREKALLAKYKAMAKPWDAIVTRSRVEEAQALWAEKTKQMELEKQQKAQKEAERKKKLEEAQEIYKKHCEDNEFLNIYKQKYGAIDTSFTNQDQGKFNALDWQLEHITAVGIRYKQMGGKELPICRICRQYCKNLKVDDQGNISSFEWPDYFEPIIEKDKK